MKSCKDCLLKTDKEFEICPVEKAKREFEKTEKIVEQKNK